MKAGLLLRTAFVALGALLTSERAHSNEVLERRLELLRLAEARPFPKRNCGPKAEPIICVWGKLVFATAHLYRSRGHEVANQEIGSALSGLQRILNYPEPKQFGTFGAEARQDKFHFVTAAYLYRIVKLFGLAADGAHAGLLSAGNENTIKALFLKWARSSCRIADASRQTAYEIWASENHAAQRDHACWAAADLLRGSSDFSHSTYEDGSNPVSQYVAWSGSVTSYIKERGTNGLFVEAFSPTYSGYTLINFYNVFDFANDDELRRLAKNLLNLWWAAWAQETVNGFHGGSKHRVYANRVRSEPLGKVPWIYFGIGDTGDAQNPVSVLIATSEFQPIKLTGSLVHRTSGRPYEVFHAVTGYSVRPPTLDSYKVDPSRKLLRYSFVTSDYVMGSTIESASSVNAIAAISSQNRWAGTVMRDGSRLSVYADTRNRNASYNAIRAAQSKSTQVFQQLPPPLNVGGARLKIELSSSMALEQRGDWMIVNGAAFIAARPLKGRLVASEEGRSFHLSEPTSPVVIQSASKSEFPTVEDFATALDGVAISETGEAYLVAGLTSALITFPKNPGDRILVGGSPLNEFAELDFTSVHLRELCCDGEIEILGDGKSERFRF